MTWVSSWGWEGEGVRRGVWTWEEGEGWTRRFFGFLELGEGRGWREVVRGRREDYKTLRCSLEREEETATTCTIITRRGAPLLFVQLP